MKHEKYLLMKSESDRLGERNDCTVKAIAIAGRVPYKVAHKALARNGRRKRCGARNDVFFNAITDIGCYYSVIRPRQPNGSRYTAKTIGKAYPRGYFIVQYYDHVAAMVNGEIADWTDERKHRVKALYRITVPRGSRN